MIYKFFSWIGRFSYVFVVFHFVYKCFSYSSFLFLAFIFSVSVSFFSKNEFIILFAYLLSTCHCYEDAKLGGGWRMMDHSLYVFLIFLTLVWVTFPPWVSDYFIFKITQLMFLV